MNACPSPEVAPLPSDTTPSSSTINRPGSVDGLSRQAKAPSAPPHPLPSREGIPDRDLGAEVDALRAELEEVRRVVNELRRSD